MRAIVFEGIDGCGKTTVAEQFAKRLNVRLLREPGGTVVGEKIRQLLSSTGMCVKAQICAYMASRCELVHSIGEDDVVVLDRYYHSSVVYQKSNLYVVEKMIKLLALPKPLVTFVIDVDPKVSLRRVAERGEYVTDEMIQQAFTNREDYLALSGVVVLDGSRTVEQLVIDAMSVVKELMK